MDVLDRMFCQIYPGSSSVEHTLLLASVLRVQQSARAARLLAVEGCVEEILSIGRSMVEVEVNAVYLQHAEARELGQYLHFQPESLYKQLGGARRSANGERALEWMQRLASLVSGNSAVVRTSEADPSWTRRSLLERAQLADEGSEVPVMASMVRRCFPRGHAAVHGTVGALNSFMAAVAAGQPAEREDRLGDLTEALFTVNLALLTLCLYLNHRFQLNMDEPIDEAANADSRSRPSLRAE